MGSQPANKNVNEIISATVAATQPKTDRAINIKAAEYRQRWKALQKAMRENGYDLAYACGSELDRSDIAYLAGFFDPIIERYGLLMPAEGAPIILAGSEGGEVAAEAALRSGVEVVLLRDYQIADVDYRHAHWSTFQDVLSRIGTPPGARVAVVSSATFMPHSHIAMLQGTCGPDNVVYDPMLLALIKYEKSDTELRIARQCNLIADAGFRGMLAALSPGRRELEVAAVGDAIIRLLGARRNGFPTIVTSGERQMTVIGPATNKVIQKGDTVSLGISSCFNGYHGVIRRTVSCGGPMSANGRSLFKAVEGAYRTTWQATVTAAKQNKPSNWIDRQYKKYLGGLRLKSKQGKLVVPMEPYTFIHNMGCSECQEGYGAVTPATREPLGNKLLLAIDVALLGFMERGKPLFDCPYAVIEDAFWKRGSQVGIYNNLPLDCQPLVGNMDPVTPGHGNPYHRRLPI